MMDRGVREQDARRTLFDIDLERQHVMDQIEWFDQQVQRAGSDITNPPGFLLAAIRDNWPVPADFETSRKRELCSRLQRERDSDAAALAEAQREFRRMECEEEYRGWIDQQLEIGIRQRYSDAARQKVLRAIRKDILSKYPGLYAKAREGAGYCPALDHHAEHEFRRQVQAELNLPSFEEFQKQAQRALF
jgi:hypothetical protein